MNGRTRTLIFSMLALCVCTVIIAGATYALFTGEVIVNNHLSAGNLKVGLNRVSYTEAVLNNKGILVESKENKDVIDLTENANPVFNVVNAIPTGWYNAKIEVSNLGTTAFDYTVKIVWSPNDNTEDNDEIFAQQIRITVSSEKLDEDVTFMLSDAASVGKISLGFIYANAEPETFTVKAEFVDTANNNDAMLANLIFDIQVHANQKVN